MALASVIIVVTFVVAVSSAVVMELRALSVALWMFLVAEAKVVARWVLIDREIAFLVCCSTLG